MKIYCINIRQNQPFFMDDIFPKGSYMADHSDDLENPENNELIGNYFVREVSPEESLM